MPSSRLGAEDDGRCMSIVFYITIKTPPALSSYIYSHVLVALSLSFYLCNVLMCAASDILRMMQRCGCRDSVCD